MNQLEEKKRIIQKELNQIQFSQHDSPQVIQHKMLQFLDQKAMKQFDRNIAEQLFERMTFQRNPIEEFADIYLEAEFVLKNKIQNTKKFLEDYHKQRRETLFKLQEAQQNETLNNYGIMPDSFLTIKVIQVKGLNSFKQLPDAYISLSCGDQTHQTVIGQKDEQNKCLNFNEQWKFSITTGVEEINLVLLHFDQYTRDNFIGTVILPVNRFRDQQKVKDTLCLYQQDGIIGSHKIELEMQWIYSKVIYLADVLRQWDSHIQQQEDDLIDFERDLSELYTPFEEITNYYQNNLQNRAQLITEHSQPGGQDLQNSQNLASTKKFEKFSVITPYLQSLFIGVQKDIYSGVRLFVAIQILVILFVNYFRPAFFDLMISLLFFAFYDLFILDFDKIYFIGALYQASFVLDLFWLYIYTHHWWSKGDNPFTDFKIEQGIKQFDIVLSYVAFLFKVKANMENVKLEKKEVIQTTIFSPNELMVSQSPLGLSMAPHNFQKGKNYQENGGSMSHKSSPL